MLVPPSQSGRHRPVSVLATLADLALAATNRSRAVDVPRRPWRPGVGSLPSRLGSAIDEGPRVSSEEVDAYIDSLDEPKRSTLHQLRQRILDAAPDLEQGLSYGVPVFRLAGKNLAGFSAAKSHLSYLPHSGTVVAALAEDDLGGLKASKGALRMPIDTPLPSTLVAKLIAIRRDEAGV